MTGLEEAGGLEQVVDSCVCCQHWEGFCHSGFGNCNSLIGFRVNDCLTDHAPFLLSLVRELAYLCGSHPLQTARVVKLVDTRDLKSLGFGHAGSTPAPGTTSYEGSPPKTGARAKYHSITPFHSDPSGTYVCYFVPVLSASGEKQVFFLWKKFVNKPELLKTLAHRKFRALRILLWRMRTFRS